jgi:hypothetical protein
LSKPILCTSKFIDVHHLGAYTDEELKKFQESPTDELGVRVLKIPYNKLDGISFCFLEAPTKKAVEEHHEKYGVKCDWITEVQTTA